MGTDTAARAAGATRLLALGGIRIAGLAVAIGAITTGVVYTVGAFAGGVVASLGPEEVWSQAGLPLEMRTLNAAAFLSASIVVAAVSWVVADLAWRIRRGVRFDTAVSRSAAWLAVTLAIGATLVQFLRNVATGMGLRYPDQVDPWTVDRSTVPMDWGIHATTFVPNVTLLGLAIVLGVLAYIIRAGERLQRETEGLV